MGNLHGWEDYGVPNKVPKNARMFVLTNEQQGLIASLVTTTNDVFSWQVPYPFYVDQENVAMIIWRMDFVYRAKNRGGQALNEIRHILQVDIQYSDKEPASNWDGAGEDTEDENIQAMFDGPFYFGELGPTFAPDADAALAVVVPAVTITNVHYYGPDGDGIDAFFPVTIVYTNMAQDAELIDQIADPATFSDVENVSVRIYFTTRNLTPQEKSQIRSEFYGLVPLS